MDVPWAESGEDSGSGNSLGSASTPSLSGAEASLVLQSRDSADGMAWLRGGPRCCCVHRIDKLRHSKTRPKRAVLRRPTGSSISIDGVVFTVLDCGAGTRFSMCCAAVLGTFRARHAKCMPSWHSCLMLVHATTRDSPEEKHEVVLKASKGHDAEGPLAFATRGTLHFWSRGSGGSGVPLRSDGVVLATPRRDATMRKARE